MQVAKNCEFEGCKKKWENLFLCELHKIIEGGKVVKLTCIKYENKITSSKGF